MCSLSVADSEIHVKLHAVLDVYEKSCSISNPDMICDCISQELRYIASLGYEALNESLNSDFKKIVNGCAISTGYIERAATLMVASCYTGNTIDLSSNHEQYYDIELLREKYPSRIDTCSCFNREVNALDEEYIIQTSLAAYKKSKEQSQCRFSGSSDTCDNIRDTGFDDLYKRCNIKP
jgi:hypothetical protein